MVESSLAPCLLVAMPQLLDPNFKRTVVLIVHHDASGTFGLVLNRTSEVSVEDLCGTLGIEWRGADGVCLGRGGPVQPSTGWLLFGGPAPLAAAADTASAGDDEDDTTELAPGLHFAGSLATLRRVAHDPPAGLRLFLGYAGWAPGQLEAELSQGAWLLAPLGQEIVFRTAPETMWETAVRGLGVDPSTLVPTPGVH